MYVYMYACMYGMHVCTYICTYVCACMYLSVYLCMIALKLYKYNYALFKIDIYIYIQSLCKWWAFPMQYCIKTRIILTLTHG